MTMTSDILTLNYCVQNELVRNTTKTFIINMEKVFKQQQKLCRDYIKFLEQIENTESKFVLKRTSDEFNQNKGSSINKKQDVTEQNAKHSDFVFDNVPNILPCSTNSKSEQYSNENKSPTRKSENDMSVISSPILPGKRLKTPKTRRHGSSQKCIISVNVSKHNISASIVDNSPVSSDIQQTEHAKIPLKVTENKSSSVENQLVISQCNDNVINDTHISNNDKTLGISKLYNVDTTFLPNGKKLKQTMLTFHPKEKNVSDIFFPENENSFEQIRNREMIKPHVQSSSAKENIDTNILQSTKSPKKKVANNKMDRNESTHEEIIEVSPVEANQKSKLKNRIKLKRKISNEPYIKCKKLPRSTHETINLDSSSSSSSMYTSTQKHQSQTIRRWNTTSGVLCDKNTKNDNHLLTMSSPPSPILADLAQAVQCFNEFEKEEVQTKSKKVTNDRPQPSRSRNVNVLTQEDETYFEQEKNKIGSDMFILHHSDFEDDIFLEGVKSVKRTLFDSFDRVPPNTKRKLSNGKNPKTKAERAKLNGWSCWECEEYYGNLGLSEEELQKRKNLCSRHRSEFKRRDTPEGFWDPLFPDTQSSTYQSE